MKLTKSKIKLWHVGATIYWLSITVMVIYGSNCAVGHISNVLGS